MTQRYGIKKAMRTTFSHDIGHKNFTIHICIYLFSGVYNRSKNPNNKKKLTTYDIGYNFFNEHSHVFQCM